MSQLTTGLLNLARVSFDDSQLIIEDVRIDELLWETKEMLLSQNKDFNIRIEYLDMPDDPEKLIIPGNKQLLQVALGNIMENACKFSDNKTVDAILKFNPQNIQITVIDKGIGIPLNDLQNIFEPFFRAGNARSYSGSGVGLSLTQKIIKLHKGTIEISSTLNIGTKVLITLPHR